MLTIGDEVNAIIKVSGRIVGFGENGTFDIELTEWIGGAVGTSIIKNVPKSQIQQVGE